MDSTPSATSAVGNTLKRLQSFSGEHRVVVGLSGGVDSSLTAALLVEAGWLVEGLTLWLMSGKGACCSDGLIDAAGICQQLGISHNVLDSRSLFKKEIVEKLVNGYQAGVTPLPCSQCNRAVKFSEMLQWAEKKFGINRLATGHYARVRDYEEMDLLIDIPGQTSGRNVLLRGLDSNKDQSYFLYDLSQEVLGKVVFPLGELTKEETRKEAVRYGLRTAQKPESQDLCLVEHYGSMRAFLDEYLPPNKGEIVLNDGSVIGNHDGIHHFTIGQRKGIGVSWSEPLHVVRLEEKANRVVVAPRSDSGTAKCIVGEINWVSIAPPRGNIAIEVQVRYRSKPVKAELIPIEPTKKDISIKRPFRCIINFQDKQFSITPGQAAVFYFGDILLGGGIIQKDS